MTYITESPTAATALGAKPDFLPVDLISAKQSLGFLAGDRDEDIREALHGVTDKVERRLNMILRTPGAAVIQSYRSWPCGPVEFDWAPVIAITHIDYLDSNSPDGPPVMVDSSNYYLVYGEVGRTVLYFSSGYSFAGLATNGNAVQIHYTAGYNSAADIPDAARNLIKTELRALYTDDERESVGSNRLANQLYDNLSWGNYR